MSNFQIGGLCVCVHATGCPVPGFTFDLAVKGHVYTIREIVVRPSYGDEVGLRFEEIVNTPYNGPGPWSRGEPVFLSGDFRPVSRTASELFHKLTSPTPRVEERVNHE